MTVAYDQDRGKGIEYFVDMAVRTRKADAVLVLLDADKECDNRRASGEDGLGPKLLKRLKESTQVPVGVVVACREYEAWLVAGWNGIVESLRRDPSPDFAELKAGAITPEQVEQAESLTGYETLLGKGMGRPYKKRPHQRLLTKRLWLKGPLAPQCRSFQKLIRELRRLSRALAQYQ